MHNTEPLQPGQGKLPTIDYNRLMLTISEPNKARLRNILFEIFNQEQKALLSRGAYQMNLKLHNAMTKICAMEMDKIEKKLYSDVAAVTYVRFIELLQTFANPYKMIGHITEEKKGDDKDDDSNKK